MSREFRLSALALALAAGVSLSACQPATTTTEPAVAAPAASAPTSDQALAFIAKAESDLAELYYEQNRAEWIYANFITDDTEALSASVGEKVTTAVVAMANEAARYKDLELPAEARRKLDLLRTMLVLPAPSDSAKTAELAKIVAELNGMYGKGKYCKADGSCLTLPEMNERMANSRDEAELRELWVGWRQVAPPMKSLYARQVELTNEGAKALGFSDLGSMWRSNYDMTPEAFDAELDRLWTEVKPLYDALHCHVRAKLGEQYGTDVVPQNGPIPAHLLGNMWAQEWGNIYPLVAPKNSDPGYDLTALLKDHGYDELQMVKAAENFFTSLGFAPLPDTFWSRSLFLQPKDRDVVCHASAWDIDAKDDIRIKMCIQRTGEDFQVIHHELGHNFYQRAYKDQPTLFQNSANDGFHEAIGDTIALSVTPEYLAKIGLLTPEQIPSADADLGLLMRQAMDKVAFLPFGLLMDKWRWQVFSGQVTPDHYNEAWWQLREQYQGVMPPVARSENDFDPGAKYHIPGNTPYARYFLARILQFQFHKALCDKAGFTGPIHRCTIYGNEAAGKALAEMLEMGSSKPWPEALAVVTGSPQMSAQPMLDYFAPLKKYLDEQNAGRQCGW